MGRRCKLKDRYKVMLGMACCGVASYMDGSPDWAMWWLVNAFGILWAE